MVLIQMFFVQTVSVNSIEMEELSEIIREFGSYVIIDTKKFCWNSVEIFFTMEFEGTTGCRDTTGHPVIFVTLQKLWCSQEMYVSLQSGIFSLFQVSHLMILSQISETVLEA